MISRIYIDTSVIGGCLDLEFSKWSQLLFKEFKKGTKTAVISNLTREEISRAPIEIKKILSSLPDEFIENIFISEESEKLAQVYINNNVINEKYINDASHIAVATVERVDILLSWNFKHIVNIIKIHNFNSVNLKLGYPVLEIRTPREVLEDEEKI